MPILHLARSVSCCEIYIYEHKLFGPPLIKVIEEMCDDPRCALVARIAFGIGDAIYKARLGNQSWLESSVYIYAPPSKALGQRSQNFR